MKRINFLYIFVILVILLLLRLNRHFGKQTLLFYGFAENKEMDINLDHSVTVNEIFVTPGQQVKKGTALASVSRSALGLKFNSLAHEISEIQSKEAIWRADIKSDIRRLEAQKVSKSGEINNKILQLRAEIDFNKKLIKDLKSVATDTVNSEQKSRQALKIEALENELELSIIPLDIEIKRLEKTLDNPDNPLKIQREKLENETQFFQNEQEKLLLIAPADGVVGSINGKAGENLDAFSTIVSFYNPKPTLVKAYVLESLILHVDLGDSLNVISSLHPEHQCGGVVVGLGSRIIEIPERLRKMPEYKTYGREVLVRIPSDNHFLQKEKVMLILSPSDENGSGSFLDPLFNFSTPRIEAARK